MKQSLPFALVFAVLSFAAAHFFFTYSPSRAAFPKWIMELEAAASGFGVALVIGVLFKDKVSTGAAVVAGFVAILFALLLTCIVTHISQHYFYPQYDSISKLAQGIVLAFIFWVLAFFNPPPNALVEMLALVFAALFSASALISRPSVAWARWGCLAAVLPLTLVVLFRIAHRTLRLQELGADRAFFVLTSEQVLLGALVLVCSWIWIVKSRELSAR